MSIKVSACPHCGGPIYADAEPPTAPLKFTCECRHAHAAPPMILPQPIVLPQPVYPVEPTPRHPWTEIPWWLRDHRITWSDPLWCGDAPSTTIGIDPSIMPRMFGGSS